MNASVSWMRRHLGRLALGHNASMTTEELLAELTANTDLARLVERVCEHHLPWVVVSTAAVSAWEQRDPAGWAKVSEWLVAQGVAVVRI